MGAKVERICRVLGCRGKAPLDRARRSQGAESLHQLRIHRSVSSNGRTQERVTPRDADLLDGVSALLATYETARRGVIYEHRPATLPGQRVMGDLTALFAEAARQAGRSVDGDAILALQRVGQLGESVRKASPDSTTAFGALLRRVSAGAAGSEAGRAAARPALIVP